VSQQQDEINITPEDATPLTTVVPTTTGQKQAPENLKTGLAEETQADWQESADKLVKSGKMPSEAAIEQLIE